MSCRARVVLASLWLGACGTAPRKSVSPATIPASSLIAPKSADAKLGGPEPDLRGADYISNDALRTVRFEYDRYALGDAERDVLKSNYDYLRAQPDLEVMVEGHCDDRGTVEYNLALGQKRAKEVRDYYLRLGLDPERVATISYGKERPLCRESAETCWIQNRRAETRTRPKKLLQ